METLTSLPLAPQPLRPSCGGGPELADFAAGPDFFSDPFSLEGLGLDDFAFSPAVRPGATETRQGTP